MKRQHNYKGGSIASNGYRIIYVGKEHHLSDIRGYAYEHRLEAEKKIGRRLKPGEHVHHIDHNKLNNRHNNLDILTSKYHRLVHRKKSSNLRLPDEQNILIKCLCGCGKDLMKYDSANRLRKFIAGHNDSVESITEKYILTSLSTGEKSTANLLANYSGGKSVKTVLTKLKKRGNIICISRGLYKLKDYGISK